MSDLAPNMVGVLEHAHECLEHPWLLSKAMVDGRRLQAKMQRQAGIMAVGFRSTYDEWVATVDRAYADALNQLQVRKGIYKDITIRDLFNAIPWDSLEARGLMLLALAELYMLARSAEKSADFIGFAPTIVPPSAVSMWPAFAVRYPKAAEIARLNAGKLVTGVSFSVRENIRNVIANSLATGFDLETSVRLLQPGLPVLPAHMNRILREANEKRAAGISDSQVNRWVLSEGTRMRDYRAFMIARTESIRAMNEGTLLTYSDLGIERVEFVAAYDACDDCLDYDGDIMSISEAHGLIPIHPNCKCAWVAHFEIPGAPGEAAEQEEVD